jgi:SH3-like domain-containing protein
MATIRARRSFIITASQASLRANPTPNSKIVAYLNNGVSGTLLACDGVSGFCKAGTGHVSGYLAVTDFWGTFPNEIIK